MSAYRRFRVAGGTIFFTVNLADRADNLLFTHINVLRSAFAEVKRTRPFRLDAIIVLPDHLHCIWTLPPGDSDYSTRWRFLKTRFSEGVARDEPLTQSRLTRRERAIWQRRFWDHVIRNESDYHAHLDYIHYNPVKHGHVGTAADWPYSSFHRFVRQGLYPANWAADDVQGLFGEAQASHANAVP